MNPLATLLALALAAPATAPDPTGPATALPCTAITGARVWLPDGPRVGPAVLIAGNRIDDVRLAAPGSPSGGTFVWKDRTCAHVDGTGLELTPGLIDADTQIGLVEVGMEASTKDESSTVADPVRAHLRVADAYDPRSTLPAIARQQGLTAALIHPRGGLVSGAIGAVGLAGRSQAEAVLRPGVAMRVESGAAPSLPDLLMRLRDLLADARLYAADPRAVAAGATRDLAASAADLAALAPVLKREWPLWIEADRAADLEALARFATEERVRIVVRGAAEGWLVAPALVAAGVAVVVDPYVYGAENFDRLQGRKDNPALLAAAGVRVVIATGSSHFSRTLRQLAGNAVRGGMTPQDALAAITAAPAAAFGLTELGAIEPGRRADLVLWSGDPLELTTNVARVWVGGTEQPLVSRQTELRDRYRVLPGTPAAPLPLP